MSHEIETAVFTQGRPAWHQLGTVVEDEALTAQDALTLGGLDWEVDKVPSYALNVTENEDGSFDETYAEVPNTYHTQRTTDNKVLGTVGERYHVLDNHEAFTFMDDLVDSGDAKYVTAGSLRGGSVVWMLMKMPEGVSLTDDEDENINKFVLLRNSHDGSTAVTAAITPVRVVCMNTLRLALGNAKREFSIRHTKNMGGKINEAKRVLGIADTYYAELEKVGKELINAPFSNAQFDAFLESLVPTEGKEKLALTVAQNKQETIKSIWANKPDLQNIKNTKWGVLNSIIDYSDHHIKGRGEDKADKRMQRILFNPTIVEPAQKLLMTM